MLSLFADIFVLVRDSRFFCVFNVLSLLISDYVFMILEILRLYLAYGFYYFVSM